MNTSNKASMRELKSCCYKNGYKLYGKDFFGEPKNRLDNELHNIEQIPSGADSFLILQEYLAKVKRIHRHVRNYDLLYSFRGPASSGLVPYLLGITNIDPMEPGFYSWSFFRKERICFNLNLSKETCSFLPNLGKELTNVLTIYLDRDLRDLEAVYKCGPDVHPEKNWKTYDTIICNYLHSCIDHGDISELNYFQSFDERYVPHLRDVFAFLKSMDLIPNNLAQLTKLNGFLHCRLKNTGHVAVLNTLARSGEDFYKNLVTCPEDVYEELVSNGCDPSVAIYIARKMELGIDNLSAKDLLFAGEYCKSPIFEQLQNINYLFYRSQVFEKSCLTAALMKISNKEGFYASR